MHVEKISYAPSFQSWKKHGKHLGLLFADDYTQEISIVVCSYDTKWNSTNLVGFV